MAEKVTTKELEEYLSNLDPFFQHLHVELDSMVKEAADTFEEDFQVAADLLEVFWKRCQMREDSK